MIANIAEVAAMRRAIALSALGLGTTSPNPPVGCVILDSTGRLVGEGYHCRKGEPHAEVHALAAAGAHASGGTAMVTLEPCNHYGRTPPCHQALLDAGIARVVIAVIDPTSRGVGGAARLRDAGVEVEVGLLADQARVVLGPWLMALESTRPRVTWACEITNNPPQQVPDNVVAEASLRYRVDAIVRTGGQVEEGIPGTHGQGSFALPAVVPTAEPTTALASLYEAGVRTALLHGGSELATPFVKQQLVDDAALFLAKVAPSQTASSFELPFADLLPGFTIRSLTTLSGGVLIEASAPSS